MTKKLSIVFFAILILFIFSGSVFAVNAEYDADHYVEITRTSGLGTTVYRITANEDFYCIPKNLNGTYYWVVYNLAGEPIPASCYTNGAFDYDRAPGVTILSVRFSGLGNGTDRVTDSKGTVILYKDENKTDSFFQQAPRLVPILIPQRGAMGEILQQVVAIVPLILVVVVSFLGLRKAWRLLSTLLHRCLIS